MLDSTLYESLQVNAPDSISTSPNPEAGHISLPELQALLTVTRGFMRWVSRVTEQSWKGRSSWFLTHLIMPPMFELEEKAKESGKGEYNFDG